MYVQISIAGVFWSSHGIQVANFLRDRPSPTPIDQKKKVAKFLSFWRASLLSSYWVQIGPATFNFLAIFLIERENKYFNYLDKIGSSY